jgi:DNA-binding NarL/FixJ family response regulator
MPSTISIAVVDDHPIFREGVVQVLKAEPGFHVVGQGESAEEAVRIAAATQPDVILLDVSMPGGGLEAARTIATTAPLTRVMMLTAIEDDSFVIAAVEAGAKGYVLKGISGPDLIQMILKVLQDEEGGFLLSPGLAAHILAQDAQAWQATLDRVATGLSDLDRRILTCMSDGWSLKRIALDVGLDEAMVQERLSRTLSVLRALSGSVPKPMGAADRCKPVLH